MRAREPVQAGTVELEGFRVAWEEFGDRANPGILLFPSWQIVHSRIWKMQLPELSRHFHVLAFDPPGNGKSERTEDPAAFQIDRVVDYGVGLLDHLGIQRASVIGLSMGGAYSLWMAARYPERVDRAVLIGSATPDFVCSDVPSFWQQGVEPEGWGKYNAHHWRQNFDDWLAFFFGQICVEPHSTKQFDDLVSWGRETTPDVLIRTTCNPDLTPELSEEEVLKRVRCPVLVIHGTDDRIVPLRVGEDVVGRRPDFQYLEMHGSGHAPNARDPVRSNQAIADFLGRPSPGRQSWRRAMAREPRRILYLSSPIGLGHIPRDLEIARHLRELVPGVQIDWLASPPVTDVLEQAGENIHPRSQELASKSSHWESMAGEHELHCFYAFREMDEIMLANFMVFLDAVRETPYDLWIGDEAWEVDHFLHENPELKTAPFVFMTDFVGFLPMDRSPGSREAFLTADYNAEMIEHIDRFPWLRDRSLYFGELDDVVPERFGPDLPWIREWMGEHFTPVGYPLTFDPAEYRDTAALRRGLGYDPDRPLVVAAIGGTATGRHLLERTVESWPLVRETMPDAQGVVVAGPRLAPETLSAPDGLRVLPYVERLYEHFAAADLGVIQGGLTSAMELTATRRPFLYFPLKNHFEQVHHVAHRLDCYGAGVRLDYHQTSAEDLAAAITEHIGADTSGYRSVPPGAAEHAAREIAAILR